MSGTLDKKLHPEDGAVRLVNAEEPLRTVDPGFFSCCGKVAKAG